MTKLVVDIAPNGTVETLLKDEKFDTRIFRGDRSIKRITLIEFNDNNQAFFIRWLRGPYSGRTHAKYISHDIENLRPWRVRNIEENMPISLYMITYFPTYQEAVAHEIDMVNRLRALGVSFA